MTIDAKFCSQCGSPLPRGARFCSNCGAPVASPQATQAVAQQSREPASSPSEPIVNIIPVQRRRGFMGLSVEFFNTVVTPQRLVLVPITKQDMQQAIQTAQAQARAAGKGFFGQWRAQLAWIQVIYEEYRATPVAKLAQKPGSIVFGNQEIRSIRLKDPPAVRPEDYGNTSHYATMNIETTRGRFGFELLTMGAREAREILQQTLGGNVR